MLRRFVPRLLDDDHSEVRLAAAASCCACLTHVIALRLASQSVAWPGLTSSQRDFGKGGIGSGTGESSLALQQQATGTRGSQLLGSAPSSTSASSSSGPGAGGGTQAGGQYRRPSALIGISEDAPHHQNNNFTSKPALDSKAALKAKAACAELFTAAVALLDRVVVVRRRGTN